MLVVLARNQQLILKRILAASGSKNRLMAPSFSGGSSGSSSSLAPSGNH